MLVENSANNNVSLSDVSQEDQSETGWSSDEFDDSGSDLVEASLSQSDTQVGCEFWHSSPLIGCIFVISPLIGCILVISQLISLLIGCMHVISPVIGSYVCNLVSDWLCGYLQNSLQHFVVLADYNKLDENEVNLREGDVVEVLKFANEGWWFVRVLRTDSEGWVPASYIESPSREGSRSTLSVSSIGE